ncbi:MAG: tryptophan--tRNA ligase, partial [Alphaproteobacteria bacterium]|nr:tryptophan--tRNA ligase [Alphaproteobacteria bacterium]
HLTDDADTLAKKIKKAKTDADVIASSMKALEHRPEARNLVNMLAALTHQKPDEVCVAFEGQNFSKLKGALIDSLHATILPIGEKIKGYMEDQTYLQSVLKDGADYANALANKHMKAIKECAGI